MGVQTGLRPSQGGEAVPGRHRGAGCHTPGNTGSPWCWPSRGGGLRWLPGPWDSSGVCRPPRSTLNTRRTTRPPSWAASKLLVMITSGGQAIPVDFSGTAFVEKCWSRHPRNPEFRRSSCRRGAGFRSRHGLWPWPGLGPGGAAGPCWVSVSSLGGGGKAQCPGLLGPQSVSTRRAGGSPGPGVGLGLYNVDSPTSVDTEAQGGDGTYPMPHSCWVGGRPGVRPRGSRPVHGDRRRLVCCVGLFYTTQVHSSKDSELYGRQDALHKRRGGAYWVGGDPHTGPRPCAGGCCSAQALGLP